jgi:uncharacterized membrane protein
LLGLLLRLYHLGVNSLWYDETVSMYLAQSDLAELLRHTAGDIHPPLYYLLLHAWGLAAGYSEFSAAFFSLFFGVLLIVVVYRVTRSWFPQRSIAIIAALLVAVSPYNIWYSQEVRMYTLGATLGLLSVYFLRRMLAPSKILSRDLILYVAVTVLGFYTLYYFLFLMVFQYIWVTVRLLQISNQTSRIAAKNSLLAFVVSQILLVVLYLPWLPIAFRQATDPPVPPWREFIALPRVILETVSALVFGQAVDYNIFGLFALLVLIPIALVIWREWQSNRAAAQSNIQHPTSNIQTSPSALFLLGYTFIPLLAIYLFSLWKPLYHVRYLFTYSPAFYILAAYALVNLVREFRTATGETRSPRDRPRWLYGLGALALVVGLAFIGTAGYSLYNFWHNEQYAEDDLRGAVAYLADRWRPGDAILVNAGYAYPAVVYYFPQPVSERLRLTDYPTNPKPFSGEPSDQPALLQTGSIGGAPNLGWNDPRSDFYPTTAEETRAALDRVLADHPRVWMLRIYDTVTDPDGIIRTFFDENATLLDDHAFSGESQARVQGFLTHPTPDLPSNAVRLDQTLGERVELVGYEPGATALEPGDYLDVVLYWKLLRSVNHNYQVTLQLLSANGENVAQTDEMPLSELLPMTRWNVGELYRHPLRLQIPASLPPGAYRAIVKLYEPRSGEVQGKLVELGNIEIN